MDESTRRSRARSFEQVADVYDRSRPDYPTEAIRWLVGTDIAPPRVTHPLVVELAAGTGELTFALQQTGSRIVAVEQSRALLSRLATRRDDEAGAPTAWPAPLQAVAEALPLASSTADAIVVAQAFQWFNHAVVLPKVAQTLRPGGVFGMVWNLRDESVPWVRRLSKIIGSEAIDTDPVPVLENSGLFQSIERQHFRVWQYLNAEGLVGLVESDPYVASRPRHERQDIIKQVRDLYHESARSTEGLVLPYRTICYRATAVHQYPPRADADNLFWG